MGMGLLLFPWCLKGRADLCLVQGHRLLCPSRQLLAVTKKLPPPHRPLHLLCIFSPLPNTKY